MHAIHRSTTGFVGPRRSEPIPVHADRSPPLGTDRVFHDEHPSTDGVTERRVPAG
jgi:hypothetical protein